MLFSVLVLLNYFELIISLEHLAHILPLHRVWIKFLYFREIFRAKNDPISHFDAVLACYRHVDRWTYGRSQIIPKLA